MVSFPCTGSETPDTLVNQCLQTICKNLFAVFDTTKDGYELKKNVVLPSEICELLTSTYQSGGGIIDDNFAHIFSNIFQTSLKTVNLYNSDITDKGLNELMHHNLEHLQLGFCHNTNFNTIDVISTNGKHLDTLILKAGSVSAVSAPGGLTVKQNILKYRSRGYVFKSSKLHRLTLRDLNVKDMGFYSALIKGIPNLTHLDLSGCTNVGELYSIKNLENLEALILFDIPVNKTLINSICELKKLKHLDISQVQEAAGQYTNENETLALIIKSLPELVSLDISGTNLAGKGVVEMKIYNEVASYESDIPGLAHRCKTPLQFLGLYGTEHRACRRFHIPAIKIAGDANEHQFLVAAEAYKHRPDMLQKVLNDLFHYLRSEVDCTFKKEILFMLLDIMNAHLSNTIILICASAALFSLFRNSENHYLCHDLKQNVVATLLHIMMIHKDDEILLRNGSLTLCQFKIPDDFLFLYSKVVNFLLTIIRNVTIEGFIQKIAMYLLNSMACQVEDEQKQALGELDVIRTMVSLIGHRVQARICDDILEIAWSTLWNVTDETAVNCERFFNEGGMLRFTQCLEIFDTHSELTRNMMGLLGNIAEVKTLRPRLMNYVGIFYNLLDSMQDGIEVSYNSAGVISHLASDGEKAWSTSCRSRREVLEHMVEAIERWSLESERNINYRSFKPILGLAQVEHTPECQHWAVWALANLTTVYPSKYVPIFEKEGGFVVLQTILMNHTVYDRIIELVNIVLQNCRRNWELEAIREASKEE